MDNSVVVAITSIATGIIAGSITLLSKLIDAFQKRNEQSMVIKTTYVNKKIEAGQSFIRENNITIHNRNLIRQYLESLKSNNYHSSIIFEKYQEAEKKLLELALNGSNYQLYFDTSKLYNRNYFIIDRLNELLPLVEPNSPHCDSNNYEKNITEAIALIDELLALLQDMNKMVREDLMKYDTI